MTTEGVSFFSPTNPNAKGWQTANMEASAPRARRSLPCASPVGAQVPQPCHCSTQLHLAEKEVGREAHFLALPPAPVLTMQLTAKELKAEGTAPVTDDGDQPHVLHFQREVKQVDLQTTVVHVTHKYLGEKQIGGVGQCGQSTFLGLPHLPRPVWEADMGLSRASRRSVLPLVTPPHNFLGHHGVWA